MKLDSISVASKLRSLTIAIVLALGASAGWMQLRSEWNEREAIDRIESAQNNVTRATRWRGLIETNIQRIIATSITADPAVSETFGPAIQKTIKESAATQTELMQSARQPEDKASFEQIGAARLHLIELTKQLRQLQSAGDLPRLSGFVKDTMRPAFDVYLGALDRFVDLQAAHRAAAKEEAHTLRRATAASGAVLLFLVACAALFGMTLVSRSICRPLAETVRLSQAIAAGDLTQQISTGRRDEIGALMSAMAEMNDRLRTLVGEVHLGVQSVTVASSEIAAGSMDLSARTERAASSLQEAASSMEQLASTVAQTAESAQVARQLASSAIDASERSGAAFEKVRENMERITGSSRRIGEITSTIDGIAFQTNILALNAAVEAAECVNDFATPEVMNLLCRAVAFVG
jgi:methyl-accepting chemotaxis protein